jgi:hypothetical protein
VEESGKELADISLKLPMSRSSGRFLKQLCRRDDDWVDPDTAEILTVDGLQHTLMTHCAKQPNFFTVNSSLVDSVFRLLLAQGNTPLTPIQMGEATGRQPDMILRTLAGSTVYKGIRPLHS